MFAEIFVTKGVNNMMKNEPTLYLIMRSDLWDNSPGKMMAQSSHATSDFEQWMAGIQAQPDQYGELLAEYDAWREDRSFGRVIVLEATLEQMTEVVGQNDFAGLTVDPTYPYRNYYGDLFVDEEVTCAWVFMCNETKPSELLQELKLHR
jgi:hypothetical protein